MAKIPRERKIEGYTPLISGSSIDKVCPEDLRKALNDEELHSVDGW